MAATAATVATVATVLATVTGYGGYGPGYGHWLLSMVYGSTVLSRRAAPSLPFFSFPKLETFNGMYVVKICKILRRS